LAVVVAHSCREVMWYNSYGNEQLLQRRFKLYLTTTDDKLPSVKLPLTNSVLQAIEFGKNSKGSDRK
jgi:hypothetical protein